MSTTLLRDSDVVPKLDSWPKTVLTNLNIMSVVTCAFTIALACLCKMRVCSTHNDKLRCRVVIILSISTACRSISQLALVGQVEHRSDFFAMRMMVFVAGFCTVLNSFLITCAISADAAVRYGLRSFRLAQKASNFYEIACFIAALAISQPMLYLFGEFVWNSDAIVVKAKSMPFAVAMWVIESGWVGMAMAAACTAMAFTLIKAQKIANYSGNYSSASIESVLGTTSSIKGRVNAAVLYCLAFCGLSVWKLAFRASGSQTQWLLFASCICEALQPALFLIIFIVDVRVNMIPAQRLEWLSASTIYCVDNSAGASGIPSEFRLESKSFTGWRKTGFMEWRISKAMQEHEKNIPTNEDIKSWMQEVKRCHIRSDTSYYEGDDYSVSDLSFESAPERYSTPVIMYPLI
ncbi:hypothetical protein BX070DRAFT_219276, partial [Coemansia spiralis]